MVIWQFPTSYVMRNCLIVALHRIAYLPLPYLRQGSPTPGTNLGPVRNRGSKKSSPELHLLSPVAPAPHPHPQQVREQSSPELQRLQAPPLVPSLFFHETQNQSLVPKRLGTTAFRGITGHFVKTWVRLWSSTAGVAWMKMSKVARVLPRVFLLYAELTYFSVNWNYWNDIQCQDFWST